MLTAVSNALPTSLSGLAQTTLALDNGLQTEASLVTLNLALAAAIQSLDIADEESRSLMYKLTVLRNAIRTLASATSIHNHHKSIGKIHTGCFFLVELLKFYDVSRNGLEYFTVKPPSRAYGLCDLVEAFSDLGIIGLHDTIHDDLARSALRRSLFFTKCLARSLNDKEISYFLVSLYSAVLLCELIL